MERIESVYLETNGKCYVSYSGGKDSTVILALILMCQDIYTIPPNTITAVYCETGLELNAISDFVRWVADNYYRNLTIIRPDPLHTFDWILKHYGKPIKSKIKSEYLYRWHHRQDEKALGCLTGCAKSYGKTRLANKDMHLVHPDFDIMATEKCCKYLKKLPFDAFSKKHDMHGYITGLRLAEGGVRALNTAERIKKGGELCTTHRKGVIVKMPIIDWSDQDISDFIESYNIPLSKAYTEYGYERTGCFLCPFSLQLAENLRKLSIYEPNRYRASLYWLQDVYIAQGIHLPFDPSYEQNMLVKWENIYSEMRYQSLIKYRPDIAHKYKYQQLTLL